jgi:ABC-type glycerol-3-phosphate transport system substrate-binding protein
MKRLFLIAIVCLIAFQVFGEGGQEGPWDREISLAGGRGYIEELEVIYPDVTFTAVDMDHSTGENITMAALMAAGTPPDIYVGFAGRAGEYLVPEFAMPLTVDESVWDQAVLDTYKRDGVLYGLPFSLPVQGMAINTDVTDAAGYTVPEGAWNTYDYIEMLEYIRQSDYEGWPTYLYAGSPSADYFWLNWFSAFGITLFDDGFTRSTFNDTTAGVEVMTFLKLLVDKGYSPEDSANEVLPGFREATIATTGFRPNWIPPHLKVAVDQGKIDAPFNYVVKPFPTAPGVAWPAPIPGVGTCVLAHITDYPEEAEILTEIVVWIAGKAQVNAVSDIMTRSDVVQEGETDAITAEIIAFTQEAGFMDPGYTYEWYGETRECALPILRDLYNGVTTPAEAAKAYEDKVNEILAEYE